MIFSFESFTSTHLSEFANLLMKDAEKPVDNDENKVSLSCNSFPLGNLL